MKILKPIVAFSMAFSLLSSSALAANNPDLSQSPRAEVKQSINSSTQWNEKRAKIVEAEIDKVLKGSDASNMGFAVENMTYIRSDTLDASDSPYATASATYKLYKEDVIDDNYDYYVVWMKGTGLNAKDTNSFGDDSNLYEVRVGTDLNRSGDKITDWDPWTDVTANEQYITVSITASRGGVGASISEDFLVHQDHIGPAALDTSATFKAHWNGNYEGSQGIIGGTEIRVPKGASYSYVINLFVDGGQH
jgi:hypothetical protein